MKYNNLKKKRVKKAIGGELSTKAAGAIGIGATGMGILEETVASFEDPNELGFFQKPTGAALSGAAKGAASGAAFGGVGAIVGAGVGGVAGLIKGINAKKGFEKQQQQDFLNTPSSDAAVFFNNKQNNTLANGGPLRKDGPRARPIDKFLPIDGNRKSYTNEEGQQVSENKKGFGLGDYEYVLPTVVDGVQLSDDDAVENYRNTGEHMGKYKTVEESNKAAAVRTFMYNNHPSYRKKLAMGGETDPPKPSNRLSDPAKNIMNVIAKGEIDPTIEDPYNSVYGMGQYGTPKKPITKQNVKQVMETQTNLLDNQIKIKKKAKGSTAVGRPQFLKDTLKGFIKNKDLKESDIFDAKTQDRLQRVLMKEAGYDKMLAGKRTPESTYDALSEKWTSLPNAEGLSSAHGDGLNKAGTHTTRDEMLSLLTSAQLYEQQVKANPDTGQYLLLDGDVPLAIRPEPELLAETPIKKAQGGFINTSLDNKVKKFKGKTHEKGGIYIGNNTEVEDGEVLWNDFVFTNRF
jgi:hypothetical protein